MEWLQPSRLPTASSGDICIPACKLHKHQRVSSGLSHLIKRVVWARCGRRKSLSRYVAENRWCKRQQKLKKRSLWKSTKGNAMISTRQFFYENRSWNRRPDGIVINKNHWTLYILEFKWSSDRNEDFLRVKKDEAYEQHKSIIEALKAAAPNWTFEQINFVAGRCGAVVEDDFYKKLERLNVQAGKKNKILAAHVRRICKAHDTVTTILLSANTWVVWGWRDDVDGEHWRTSVCVNNSQPFCHQLMNKSEDGAKLE